MTSTVSVCVQTYNQGKYIKQCLDGILMQQTNFKFEIILGEDESSDDTREICKAYAEKYPDKIRLFLRSREDVIYINGNPTGRYNFIENLKVCTGKYIALCEGDDYWTDPLKLQKQVDLLVLNKNYSGSFHETYQVDENSQILDNKIYGRDAKDVTLIEDTFSNYALFHTTSFLFRKDALPQAFPEWFYKVVSADLALFSLIAENGPLIKIPQVMSCYRQHLNGVSKQSYIKRNGHELRIQLMKNLDNHFKYQYKKEIGSVISFHKQQMDINKYNQEKKNKSFLFCFIYKLKKRLIMIKQKFL